MEMEMSLKSRFPIWVIYAHLAFIAMHTRA